MYGRVCDLYYCSRRDYENLKIRAAAGLDGPITYDENFKNNQLREPQQPLDYSRTVQKFCDVI